MKKYISWMLAAACMLLLLIGCYEESPANQDGNLIVTNYAAWEISDIVVSHDGQEVAASPEPIKDTQLCHFTIGPEENYTYMISFTDDNGGKHAREFTDSFVEETQILIAVRYENDAWIIERDE